MQNKIAPSTFAGKLSDRKASRHRAAKIGVRAMIAAFAFLSAMPLLASAAVAKETLKFAVLADPSRDAIMWAFKHGKVTSDKIDIETSAMSVPALTQAMSSRQFDVVEVSPFAIPAGAQRGLELTIIGGGLRHVDSRPNFDLWVKKDGPIQKPEDLIGQQVALYSLRSVLAVVVYSALSDNLKLDLSKIQFVEMPPPAMPAALATGRVAAASLIQAQAYQADKSGEYKVLIRAGEIFKNMTGLIIPSSVIAGYPEKLRKNPEIFLEFLRVLKASYDYAIAHPQEVFPAVAKEINVEPEFFTSWFREYQFAGKVDADVLKALDVFWEGAKKYKWIERYPPAQSVVWDAIAAKPN